MFKSNANEGTLHDLHKEHPTLHPEKESYFTHEGINRQYIIELAHFYCKQYDITIDENIYVKFYIDDGSLAFSEQKYFIEPPVLSILVYLSDYDTVVDVFVDVDFEEYKYKVIDDKKKIIISFPKKNKHVCFHGNGFQRPIELSSTVSGYTPLKIINRTPEVRQIQPSTETLLCSNPSSVDYLFSNVRGCKDVHIQRNVLRILIFTRNVLLVTSAAITPVNIQNHTPYCRPFRYDSEIYGCKSRTIDLRENIITTEFLEELLYSQGPRCESIFELISKHSYLCDNILHGTFDTFIFNQKPPDTKRKLLVGPDLVFNEKLYVCEPFLFETIVCANIVTRCENHALSTGGWKKTLHENYPSVYVTLDENNPAFSCVSPMFERLLECIKKHYGTASHFDIVNIFVSKYSGSTFDCIEFDKSPQHSFIFHVSLSEPAMWFEMFDEITSLPVNSSEDVNMQRCKINEKNTRISLKMGDMIFFKADTLHKFVPGKNSLPQYVLTIFINLYTPVNI